MTRSEYVKVASRRLLGQKLPVKISDRDWLSVIGLVVKWSWLTRTKHLEGELYRRSLFSWGIQFAGITSIEYNRQCRSGWYTFVWGCWLCEGRRYSLETNRPAPMAPWDGLWSMKLYKHWSNRIKLCIHIEISGPSFCLLQTSSTHAFDKDNWCGIVFSPMDQVSNTA